MKKFLSVILVVLALLSITACGPIEAYLQITAPGTHPLQVFGPDNKAEDAEWPWAANQHVRLTSYGVSDEMNYISHADSYGSTKIGACIKIDNPYVFPATYENAKITVEVQVNYRTYISSQEYKFYITDPVEVEIELNENGVGETIVWVDLHDEVARNTYFEGNVYVSNSVAYGSIDFTVISRISDASGTVTYYEKVDPTPIPTATPKA